VIFYAIDPTMTSPDLTKPTYDFESMLANYGFTPEMKY
jgi:hypothetical protein